MIKRSGTLIEVDHQVLQQLGRLRFATAHQLAYWCDVHATTVTRRLNSMLDDGLVSAHRHSRPAIWYLSYAGARVIQQPTPTGRRQPSWSVMAHACHTNETEIVLRQSHADFRFMDRVALFKQGFNPAHGEHAGVDRNKVSYFVLIDDYAMTSDRIEHSWQRRHVPQRKYWSDPAGRAWQEVVNKYCVVTTDAYRAPLHQTYVRKNHVPADVMTIKGLWS